MYFITDDRELITLGGTMVVVIYGVDRILKQFRTPGLLLNLRHKFSNIIV